MRGAERGRATVNNAAVSKPNREPTSRRCCCCLEEPRTTANIPTNQKGKQFNLQPGHVISPVQNPRARLRVAPSPWAVPGGSFQPSPTQQGVLQKFRAQVGLRDARPLNKYFCGVWEVCWLTAVGVILGSQRFSSHPPGAKRACSLSSPFRLD